MDRLPSIAAFAVTAALGPAVASPALADGLPNGTYHCIAGYSIMLTMGDMTITGNSYSYKPEGGGAVNRGTYSMTPAGIRWGTDLGAIKQSMITESGRDASPNVFWLRYRYDPSRGEMTVVCKH